MKHISFVILFVLFFHPIYCQPNENQKYLLTSATNTLHYNSYQITDPYLSPLEYQGIGFGYDYSGQRFLSKSKFKFSKVHKLSLYAGNTFNPPHTASMSIFGANYGWGIHHHFKQLAGLKFQLGAITDLDFGMKYLSRNVNNPVNVDLSTNLNLSGSMHYNFRVFRKEFKALLSLKSPLLGCMYVPYSGASYYEMFSLGNTANTIHFSSLHNKRGIESNLFLEIPLRKSIWQLGVGYETMKWKANDLIMKRNYFSVSIANKFDFISFAGRKNKAPTNFISPTE